MTPPLAAHALSKWFGEVVAVNNLNLEIGPGVTGLLGPNGAGKSTFIKLALGLYAPSRGDIQVLGESSPRNNLELFRRIAYCPETDKFYDNMSGFEFVYWMNRFYGMYPAVARQRAANALERVKMTARMDDPIDEYSKGMRQRVKIAQTLALDPDLYLFDEPMTGLDPEGREEMFALLRELGESGHAVIVSTHILYEVERITNNVVLLHNGCVLAQGQIREIRDLIDEHPHAITIASPNPHAVAGQFVGDPATLSVEFVDGGVTIRTKDPNVFYQKLNDLVLERCIEARSITCPDDNLQSVFDYLVK